MFYSSNMIRLGHKITKIKVLLIKRALIHSYTLKIEYTFRSDC
jgi:hypothetical protein